MRCPACGVEREPTLAIDARCGCGASAPCPPVHAWPRELKRWVQERLVLAALAPHGGDTDYAWRHMLAVLFRGVSVKQHDGTVQHFSFAATPDEVFAVAYARAMQAAQERHPKPETVFADRDANVPILPPPRRAR